MKEQCLVMTKRDLIVKIAEEGGFLQADVSFVIQRTLDLIAEELAAGRNVELRKFGVFDVRVTKQRIGRNPAKPQDTVIIPERATIKFRAGKQLKGKVEKLTL